MPRLNYNTLGRMRSFTQWQDMIARTRPTEFAVQALKNQLEREQQHLEPSELTQLWQLIAKLEPETATQAQNGVVNLDYRAEGMGGKGRLYLEVGGRTMREVLDNEVLDAAQVYIFMQHSSFAALQVDAANTLPERLPPVLRALEALNLEPLDCPEAGLAAVSIATILEWAVRRYLL